MKMKVIVTVMFLVFISIISLKANVTKANKLNMGGPGKPVGHSVAMSVAVAGVW